MAMKNENAPLPEAPGPLFLATLLAFIACVMLTAGVTLIPGLSLPELLGQLDETAARQSLRLNLLLSNLLLFAGAALLALLIVYQGQVFRAAGLTQAPRSKSVAYATGFFVVALPMVTWLAYWNLQLELPEWMQLSEDSADELLKGVLRMESVPEFLLALTTVAVVPALGEELLLRGVVQRRILQPFLGNHHAAIWASAALFSAMHLEFGGFVPRMILGVLLGYAYYWSRSLWVPIGLHFFFNGMQVVIAYLSGEFDPQADMTEVPSVWVGVVSLVATGALFWYTEKRMGE